MEILGGERSKLMWDVEVEKIINWLNLNKCIAFVEQDGEKGIPARELNWLDTNGSLVWFDSSRLKWFEGGDSVLFRVAVIW